ncbi:hypothetical protein [Sphingobacterium mizutaii]|uniref:hypothetical protein n=1 Tax=Sphingobacterium mizutaii TaxID=1010 RepID=UPI001626FC67|nr:hypothetical protein [Sphingobacterium mizutaii]
MKKKYIIINKGQYLKNVLNQIPSNAIIRKNLTGIGATTLEIEFGRNSIIILPNLPVIYSKESKYRNNAKGVAVMGVHGDRSHLEIIEFLSKNKDKHIKFLVTPESYFKLKECFKNQSIDYKKDYFLLFDECDRICKDIDYRKTISLPMYEFFDYDNKAFISATAMMPRDARFSHQQFEFIDIVPSEDFVITQDIKLYKTNNTMDAFSYLHKQDITDKNYFIFCNSINIAVHLINANGLHESSSIFCSETSKEKIKKSRIQHVSDKLDESKFSKFNFFTSRFFSALDIEFAQDVEIYIISDLGIAEYTLIDPATDAIQIIGRFRNKDIKKNVTILFTEEPDLPSLTDDKCLSLVDKYQHTYNDIINIGKTLPDNEFKRFVTDLRKRLDFNHYIFIDGTIDYFKVDHLIYKQYLNKIYQKFDNLIEAYKGLKIGNTDQHYFNVKYVGSSTAILNSASAKLFTNVGQKLSTIIKEVVTLLDSCQIGTEFEISNAGQIKEELTKLYPDIVLAHEIVNRNILLLIEKPIELEREIRRALVERSTSNLSFLEDLKVEFLIGEKLTTLTINARFQKLIDKHNLRIRSTKTGLEKYVLFRRTEMNGMTAYKVIGYTNNY